MYAVATCLASVLRGTTTDTYLDVVDTDTSVATGVLAAIRRTSKAIRAQVQSDTDVRVGDRLRDDTHGGVIYTVENVTDPSGVGNTADLELDLNRFMGGVMGGGLGVPSAPGGVSQEASTGQVEFSAIAAVALSGHRMVTPRPDGTIDYASNTVAAHLHAPLWVTRGAASAGQSVTVLAYGALTEPSWAWTPGVLLFLGANGLLTQIPPVAPGALFSAQVGTATSPTSAFFDREPSIGLV